MTVARRKRKTRMTPGRYCVGDGGYIYKYSGKRNWRRSSAERWEIVASRRMCGRRVGERTIDGARVVVVTAGKRFYAALPHGVQKMR